MGYFARRTHDPQAAADLTSETFASAIVAQHRFRRDGAPATARLFAIAARRLADYQRRGWVDERVRRSLAMERRLLSEEVTFELLSDLPADQRDAVTAHVVEDRGYPQLATDGSRRSGSAAAHCGSSVRGAARGSIRAAASPTS